MTDEKALEAAARAIAQHLTPFPFDKLPRNRAHTRELERAGCTPCEENQETVLDIVRAAITAYNQARQQEAGEYGELVAWLRAATDENGDTVIRDDVIKAAANAIEVLVAERDRPLEWNGQASVRAEQAEDRAETAEAERDKLKELLVELEEVIKDAFIIVACLNERHCFDGDKHEWEALDRLRARFWPNLAALENNK